VPERKEVVGGLRGAGDLTAGFWARREKVEGERGWSGVVGASVWTIEGLVALASGGPGEERVLADDGSAEGWRAGADQGTDASWETSAHERTRVLCGQLVVCLSALKFVARAHASG